MRTENSSIYEPLFHSAKNEADAIERLANIVHVLRKECPWDKVQTHESLKRCMIEEAYESIEAIDNNDFINLREELGDVLLQVVFHADLAHEESYFDLKDVINDECEKMIRRHPHIFSEETAKTVDKVIEKWENVKSKEHGNTTHTQRLKDVPKSLPALLRSEKVLKRAVDANFEQSDLDTSLKDATDVIEKIRNVGPEVEQSELSDRIGDLLLSIVNASRLAGVDPEDALSFATKKFINRFDLQEQMASVKDAE
ncbi:Nucleoside triphosphate pyrophosphohydrolase [[Eubacterium] infirmum]|nr:Nucleoside triphosphate pyrophosphohydrolase [[Eubacterium] infirmum]